MTEFNVTFKSFNKSIRVARGTELLDAAVKCGIVLNASCGGEGLCGKCRVIIKSGKVKAGPSRLISAEDSKDGVVLACQTIVESDLKVDIPKESLGLHEKLSHDAEEFTKGEILKQEKAYPFSPLVRKIYLELLPPSADDNLSDLDRIARELAPKIEHLHLSTRLSGMKHLSDVLRESGFKVTVSLGYINGSLEILAVESGDTHKANYGMAFDIGTTTVAGQLVDLNNGDILGTRIAFNKQSAFGSDVITRIIYASEADGLKQLNEAVVGNINEIIEDLAGERDLRLGDIYSLACAGNMTMMHLLLEIDPSNIRKAPYIPTTVVFPAMHASELDVEINPRGLAAFLPGVSTYVGGDIVAGVLACGLAEHDDISLLADIGTNGEIVLGNREWMIGSAASAGPAFEGSGLSHGMKAVRGAIQKISIDDGFNVKVETIGKTRPKGICGSGYIDLLCQMLKRKVLEKDGKIRRTIKSDRIRKGETTYEFVVAFAKETDIGRDIVITEDDIENLKRSKGAIYSAIISLLNKVGKDIKEVKRIYIAGGFGNYLNIENSIYIGLMPDIDRSVYQFVGNSSLAGARMSLLSHKAFARADEIYKNITYLDLSSEPGYMDEYVASLFFPHTDLGRFPSVR